MKDETKTAQYQARYRQLKIYYENQLDQKIVDRTWYKVLKFVRDHMGSNFNIYSEDVVLTLKAFAAFRKIFQRFSFSDLLESPIYPVYKKFSTESNYYTCPEFLGILNKYLDLSRVSNTTIYKWFRLIGCPYNSTSVYHSKDLAFFIIATLRSPKVTIIVPENKKLVGV